METYYLQRESDIMNIARRLVELLGEEDFECVLNKPDTEEWFILYWPKGMDGPIEEIRSDTLIADLWWLDR